MSIDTTSETVPLAVPNVGERERRYLNECVETNYVSSIGPFVGRFEDAFAKYLGARHAVACSTGTAAIHVALIAAGVEAGDDVLVSDFTFVATANPITYVGARPVFVDADSTTWNIDAGLIAEALDRRAASGRRQPKAVVVAHVLGLAADIEPIRAACDRHGVMLIEDAAESLGAQIVDGTLAGKHVGTIGALGCFSFNGNKIMTTGGGGMIVTADEAFARRGRHLTTQAKLPGAEYLHDEIGFNYRLTNLAAALGLGQLERLDDFLSRKRAIASRYDEAFRNLAGVTVPPRPSWSAPSMWLYSVLIDPAIAGVDRKMVAARLESRGIQTRPVWAPLHMMPFYKDAPRIGGCIGERLFACGLSLPCSTGLETTDQDRVIDAFRDAVLARG